MAEKLNVLHDIYATVAHLRDQRQAERIANPGTPQDDLYAEVSDTRLLNELQMSLDAGRTHVPEKTSQQLQTFLMECNLVS